MSEWTYYVVENCFVVRQDPRTSRAERLHRDGSWREYTDLGDISRNGSRLKSEAEALEMARILFDMYPELP